MAKELNISEITLDQIVALLNQTSIDYEAELVKNADEQYFVVDFRERISRRSHKQLTFAAVKAGFTSAAKKLETRVKVFQHKETEGVAIVVTEKMLAGSA
jgi:hypothetical protein